MTALKLFISHSSRLDEDNKDGNDPEKNPNLKLLLDVIKEIKATYGDTVEVLVDKDPQGLPAGHDWEKRLNEWLAECHVAIILFSKRALENSNWVKKEATILSWRREMDKDFILIPVLLKDQTTPEDLTKDLLGTLRINKDQCIRDVANSQQVLDGLKVAIGKPDTLEIRFPNTPFDKLAKKILVLLEESASSDNLQEAWDSLEANDKPEWHFDSGIKFANALTRFLLRNEKECIQTLQKIIDKARPKQIDHAKELLSFIRYLWVDARAAGLLPGSLHHHRIIAMNGRYLMRTINGGSSYFTLDRYCQRAWPDTNLINIITISITPLSDPEDIKQEIRDRFGAKTDSLPAELIDEIINDDPQQILVYIPANDQAGGLLDSSLLMDLRDTYQKIIFILGCGDSIPTLPRNVITPVVPELDFNLEAKQEIIENRAIDFINRMYAR